MSTVELSLVIPAFNERERLAPTVRRAATFLGRRAVPWELLVVDDGSTDGTGELARELARDVPELRVLGGMPNRGKGHAVRTGMLAARGAVRVMSDADGSMPVEELAKLLDAVAAGADVAIGSRYVGGAAPHGQPLWRRAWSRVCNQVIQRTILPGVADSQCGFKAFTAEAARDLFSRATASGWAFDLEILALARRLGYAVEEVGVSWRDDRRSRVRPLRDLVRVVREAVAIQRALARLPDAAR